MNINKMKKQFDLYKKWFKTLLIKEFFNLPFEKQKEFMTIAEQFIQNCNRIHKEAEKIIEKTFTIKIKRIIQDSEKTVIIGLIEGKEIKIEFPSSEVKPKIGNTITCILYSIDKQEWYSSKMRLIEEAKHDQT